MNHIGLLILSAFVFTATQGLRCWTCDNAVDDEECQERGHLVECRENEEMCFTETRIIRSDLRLITRRCKQALACENNHIQNPRAAWLPTQCNERQGSVCRCCCDKDECNAREETQCFIGDDQPLRDPEPRCPIVESLPNGRVTCQGDDDAIRVTCRYQCDTGFVMMGESASVCDVRLGDTGHMIPECIESPFRPGSMLSDSILLDPPAEYLTCDEPPAPLNGKVSCSAAADEDRVEGSDCEFSCNAGYTLEGAPVTICMFDKSSGDLKWSEPVPECRPRCRNIDAIPNGSVTCSDDVMRVGSRCSFECAAGFSLQGEDRVTCVMRKDGSHGYDRPVPTCQRIPRCRALSKPEHGAMSCQQESDEIAHAVGTVCNFRCDRGYRMVGDDESVCVATGDGEAVYNKPTPVCQPITCDMPKNLRRVEAKCSRGNMYGSTCQYKCERELYTPDSKSKMENRCRLDGTWSSPPPCCRLPCPPHTIMDLVIVLDSSSSVKIHNWKKVVKFVGDVVEKLDLSHEASQVYVIRYNSEVDENNQLLFTQSSNKTQIDAALASIPYDGRGTYTGKALSYLRSHLLRRATNRPNATDVVLLLTDGRASDDVKLISSQLRDDGVEMFAIGVGKARRKELLEITGSRAKIWPTLNDFDELTEDAATRIGNYICEKSCA